MAATLPPGWSKILEDIRQRLDQALMLVDIRLQQTTILDTAQLAERRQQDAVRFEQCLHGLTKQLESSQTLVKEVDTYLQLGEEVMSQQIGSSESLKQRLAEWAGRAIG